MTRSNLFLMSIMVIHKQFKHRNQIQQTVKSITGNSENIYHKVFGAICEHYGKQYTWELIMKHMGTHERDTARIIVESLQLPITVEEFLDDQRERLIPLLPTTKIMPGVEHLVRHLSKHKIPLAIATSSTEESFNLKKTHFIPLFSLFHHVVTGGSDPEVKNGKPAPDIYLVCASRFPEKPAPAKVLVFEDAPNGVQGSMAAGMQVVMVPDPHILPEKKQGATLVLSSLEQFKPELFGLPKFD